MIPQFLNLESISNQSSLNLSTQASVMTGPVEMSFDVTYKCPFNCIHCYNCSGDRLIRNELTDDEVLQVAKQMAEIMPLGACLCGGEPLMRGETLFKIIEILTRGGVKVNMVSNGYLMTYDKIVNIRNSGLNGIQISVDGATKESHERVRLAKNSYEKAMEALQMACEIGMNEVMVAFSPTKFNIDEFEDLIPMLQKIGVNQLRVQPIMPQGDGLINVQEILPSESQYRKLVNVVNTWERNRAIDPKNHKITLQWGDPIDHMIRFTSLLKDTTYMMEIKADGNIGVSSYLGLSVGNLRKHSILDYWEAGYNKIWTNPIVQLLASQFRSVNDMAYIFPLSYLGNSVEIDLVDDSPEKNQRIADKLKSSMNGRRVQDSKMDNISQGIEDLLTITI